MAAISRDRLGEQLTGQELQAIREAYVRHFTEHIALYDNLLRTATAESGLGNKVIYIYNQAEIKLLNLKEPK